MSAWTEICGEARWNGSALRAHLYRPERRRLAHDADVVVAGEIHHGDALVWVRDRLASVQCPAPPPITGAFAAVGVDVTRGTLVLATDAFGIRPLYYWSDGERVVFATRLADLVRAGGFSPTLDWTAVYHYLNFTYVPGPGTIFSGMSVVPPGSLARCTRGKAVVERYWDVAYPADASDTERALATALRHEIDRAVRASWPGLPRGESGCFLSGGTDSGTVAGILSTVQRPLKAYSIAFTENAYDELGYAKILARRYGLEHHVHHLTPEDLLASIPVLVAGCDQPFGNPSAIGTWRCARLARETGVEAMIAGDGGDELFGGNERYAKDYVYRLYHRLPAVLRRAVLDVTRAVPGRGLALNRLRNFAERGNVPNPDRLYADDALASRRWDGLVRAALRARVRRDASVEVMRDHWARVERADEVDRLMYVDLKTAIWGNDLVKVVTAARAAGVRVRFPLLDPALADFTGRLGGTMKVRRLEKRYLFKRAVADLLPAAVLAKKKHGFGVPVGEWVRTDPRVRDAVLDPILDRRSILRECITSAGLERLVDEHDGGEWDHGVWLWALMMLARWHAAWRGVGG